MANIDPAPSWAPIRQLETTDRNLAGLGGVLNTQPVSIAARLNLLRDNATALNNTVAGVSSRQDSADSAIASLESQVIDAPGTLSDLDHGAPISVTGDSFPDVLSIDNSRGPVISLNESIADLAQRDAYLDAKFAPIISGDGASSVNYLAPGDGGLSQSISAHLSQCLFVTSYGAKGIGPTYDDSASIQLCLNQASILKKPVFFPACPQYYVVGDVTIPDYSTIIGCAARPYTTPNVASVTGIGGAIVRKSGATSVFKWGSFVTARGIVIFGNSSTVNNIQPRIGITQIDHLTVEDCGFYSFAVGFGGASPCGGARVLNCNIASGVVGITNLVDSKVIGGFVNANSGSGIVMGNGANDNAFESVKVEFNELDNYNFFQSSNNTVTGGVADRAGRHNVYCGAQSYTVINGQVQRRAGRNGSGANLRIEDATCVVAGNCYQLRGAADGGSGTITPATSTAISGTNGTITLTGIDMSRGFADGGNALTRSGTATQLIVKNCIGTRDILARNGEYEGGMSVVAGATGTLVIPLFAAAANSVSSYNIDVQSRSTTPKRYSLGAAVQIWREGGAAVSGNLLLRYADASSGIVGTEEMALSVSAVATDGSSITLAIKNNAAVTMGVRIRLTTSVA